MRCLRKKPSAPNTRRRWRPWSEQARLLQHRREEASSIPRCSMFGERALRDNPCELRLVPSSSVLSFPALFLSNFPVTISTTLCARRQSGRDQAPGLLEMPPRSQRRRTENAQHLPKDKSLGGLDVHARLGFWQHVRDSDAVARTKIAAPSFPPRFLSSFKKEKVLSVRRAGCSGLQERREAEKSQYESGSDDDRYEIAREQMGSLARRRVSRT